VCSSDLAPAVSPTTSSAVSSADSATQGPILNTNVVDSKQNLINYTDSLRTKEGQDKAIRDAIGMVSGNVGAPLLKTAATSGKEGVQKLSDLIFNRVRTTGANPGFTRAADGQSLSKSAQVQKQEFLKKASDEVAVILSKATKSPEDLERLRVIAERYPSFSESIRSYLRQ